MGVWIETNDFVVGSAIAPVTPCMGVWIETTSYNQPQYIHKVTPCMGVWIETFISQWQHRSLTCHTLYGCVDWNRFAHQPEPQRNQSHPVWVCGLKRESFGKTWNYKSHTLYGCVDWNKPKMAKDKDGKESHPVWVCGLKHRINTCGDRRRLSHTLYGCVDWNIPLSMLGMMATTSHPVWVCGLKHTVFNHFPTAQSVTPCMGVWIETLVSCLYFSTPRHTLYGCVDWNALIVTGRTPILRHTLYGCVDWNIRIVW